MILTQTLSWLLTGGGVQEGHGAEQQGQGGGEDEKLGSEFIMHHITDHKLFDLQVFGIDISITKHILIMWIVSAMMILLFGILFRKPKMVPHGLANFFELIIEYLDQQVMKPFLGDHSRKYAPYLLTAFFFVLFCNLLGLVPGSATATSNISVTAALAVITFVMVIMAGIKYHGLVGYCKGLIPPGLPVFILPIIIPVEILGLFTKHFALAIRLFANMVAGHVVVFAFLMIIFTFKNWAIGGTTLLFLLFVSLLEVLIGLIQAYIFTILSAVFIGMSIHQDH